MHGSTAPALIDEMPPAMSALAADVLERIDHAVMELDPAFRVTYVNAAAARLFGRRQDLLLGKSLWLEFPELEATTFGAACQRAMHERREVRLTDHYAPLGAWIETHVRPSGDGVLVVSLDVTERRRLEARLAHVEDELRMVTDTVPAAITYIDRNETYQFVNRTAETWYGMPAEAVVGLHVSAVLGDEAFAPVKEHLARALAGESFTVRVNLVYPTGPRWIEATFVPRRIGDGRPVGAVLMAMDVTERRANELERATLVAELQQSEGRARRLHESGVIGVVQWRREGALIDANDAFLTMIGYPREELLDGTIDLSMLTPPEFADLDRRALAEIDARGLCTPYEKELVHKDGHAVPILIGAAMMKGSTTEGVAWIHDNTARKYAEERQGLLLRAGRSLAEYSLDAERALTSALRLLVPSYADAAYIDHVSDDGELGTSHVAHRGPDFEGMLMAARQRLRPDRDHPALQAVREGRGSVIHFDDDLAGENTATSAERRSAVERYRSRSGVVAPMRARGRLLAVLVFMSTTRDYDDADVAMAEELARQFGVAIDNARLFDAAQLERRHAEETSRAKDEFLAMVSHELRTPLNAMLGWTSLIRGGKLAEGQQARGLEVIDRNVHLQVQLVEDLLDISRVITGKLRLDVQSVVVSDVVGLAVETLRPAAEGKGLRLTQVVDAGAAPVMGDPDRLRQVVYNLLTNAVRHTPRGGHVEVVVSRHESHVELRVVDSGEGLARELVPHVFERFRQGEGGSTRRYGGLGLGLAIVKHIVELHGGTISAESEGEGRGATFLVRIPIAAVRAVPPSARVAATPTKAVDLVSRAATADLEGLLVLVVDDDDDTRELLRAILEMSRARVLTAASAQQAFEIFTERRPSVILSDIGMPHEDGYALIERVRRLPDDRGGRTPAVALTAFARLEDRTKALLAGFTMHLAKPVDGAELVVVLAAVSGRIDTTSRAR
jgi:PAS domain S-box-containing protein